MYEIKPKKAKLSIDLNVPATDENQELKNGNRVKAEIKPKV
jgi:hypothetical protein